MRALRSILMGLVLGLPAFATTSYNSLTSMETANPSLTFDNLGFGDPGGGSATSYTFIVGDLNFVFEASQTSGLTKDTPPAGWPTGTRVRTFAGLVSIELDLPAEVIGFGASFGWITGGFNGATTITIAGTNAGAFSYTLTPANNASPVYLGVVGTGSFSTITMTIGTSLSSGQFGLNNFSYALAPEGSADLPEPGSMVLLGTGLLMVPLWKRLKRRRR